MSTKKKQTGVNTQPAKQVLRSNKAEMRVYSSLVQRADLASRLGMQFSGKRDLYAVFGYNKQPSFEDYWAKYVRHGIAKRIVDAPATATWRNTPSVEFVNKAVGEKAFLKAWNSLVQTHRLLATFSKVDRLAGLGNYAVMLLGLSDDNDFKQPVSTSEKTSLLYVQTYMQKHVEIMELDTDTSSPRYGLPTLYRIKPGEPLQGTASSVKTATSQLSYIDVHFSRVVHVAEDALDNNFIGTPRLEAVYNHLEDLEKVVGGTSETFWLAAYKGMQLDIDKDAEMTPEDEAALSDEIDEYEHNLRRFLRTRGVTVKDLGSDVNDPKGTFDVILGLISGTTGIPRRILLGSELGQLASDQDRANWSDRIKERRTNFAEPCILVPFMQRMIEAGILPKTDLGNLSYVWPPNFQLTPLEEAQSQAQRARALANLAKHLDTYPLCSVSEARVICGLPAESPPDLLPPPVKETPPSGGTNKPGASKNPNSDVTDDPSAVMETSEQQEAMENGELKAGEA